MNDEFHLLEYRIKLKQYLWNGDIQYVFDKSAQLGLDDFIDYLINLSHIYPIQLDVGPALQNAAQYGHIYIVQQLLLDDADNELYYNKKLEDDEVRYTNKLLTSLDLKRALHESKLSLHESITNIIKNYYDKSRYLKENYNEEILKLQEPFDLIYFLRNDKILIDL